MTDTKDAVGPAAPCAQEFIDLAERLADAARPIALQYFRSSIDIEIKADRTPVTVADREAEAAMRALIGEAYPNHGILGEELGPERAEAEYVWVLDPIDGTASFVAGKPIFGILIALAHFGRPILGVIDMPALGERWIGADGRETDFNNRPARTRLCAELGDAWLAATSPDMFEDADYTAFETLRKLVYRPTYGGDCYNYGLLANGSLDLVVEAGTKPYDFMALVPVVAGAGGTITDWAGDPLTIASDGRVLAAGDGRTHMAALMILSD